MQISVQSSSGTTSILRVNGVLNAHTAPSLKEQITAQVSEGVTQFVIDLTQVDFIDSSGLAVLVSGMKNARANGGNLKLAGVQSNVMRVFELTLLDKVFTFFPNEQSALASFSA